MRIDECAGADLKVLRETSAVVFMNLQSLPQRYAASAVTVVGVAAAVAVLVSVLGMAEGFRHFVSNSGYEDRALVLANGAFSESSSLLPRLTAAVISDVPVVQRNADGKPLVSAEAVVLVQLNERPSSKPVFVTLRGIAAEALPVRKEMRLVSGRTFGSGVHELMVGRLAAEQYALVAGSTLNLNGVSWKIVGVFDAAGGGGLASELLADLETVLTAYRRNQFQSVTAQLDSAASYETFRDALAVNPLVRVEVQRESEYYAAQAKDLTDVLRYVAWGIGGLMALGALLGAVNTMYSAVRSRSRETATLRALGFAKASIMASLLTEALLLCLLGAALGVTIAWIFVNGATMSLPKGAGEQLVYSLKLDFGTILIGMVVAGFIGIVSASFPISSALRASIPASLQERA